MVCVGWEGCMGREGVWGFMGGDARCPYCSAFRQPARTQHSAATTLLTLPCAARAALLSFATPELLGSASTFNRVYAAPITRSRDRDASRKEQELGAARSQWVARSACPACSPALQCMRAGCCGRGSRLAAAGCRSA
jgi:hypothetical protein